MVFVVFSNVSDPSIGLWSLFQCFYSLLYTFLMFLDFEDYSDVSDLILLTILMFLFYLLTLKTILLKFVYFSDVEVRCFDWLKVRVLRLFWCFFWLLYTFLMFLDFEDYSDVFVLSYWLWSLFWLDFLVYSDVSFDLKSDVLIGLGLGFWCFLTLKTIVMFLIYPIDYSDVSVLSYWLWSLFWLDFLVYSDVSFDFLYTFLMVKIDKVNKWTINIRKVFKSQ